MKTLESSSSFDPFFLPLPNLKSRIGCYWGCCCCCCYCLVLDLRLLTVMIKFYSGLYALGSHLAVLDWTSCVHGKHLALSPPIFYPAPYYLSSLPVNYYLEGPQWFQAMVILPPKVNLKGHFLIFHLKHYSHISPPAISVRRIVTFSSLHRMLI